MKLLLRGRLSDRWLAMPPFSAPLPLGVSTLHSSRCARRCGSGVTIASLFLFSPSALSLLPHTHTQVSKRDDSRRWTMDMDSASDERMVVRGYAVRGRAMSIGAGSKADREPSTAPARLITAALKRVANRVDRGRKGEAVAVLCVCADDGASIAAPLLSSSASGPSPLVRPHVRCRSRVISCPATRKHPVSRNTSNRRTDDSSCHAAVRLWPLLTMLRSVCVSSALRRRESAGGRVVQA